MATSCLVLETSDRVGAVGLFLEGKLFAQRELPAGRRPNRDLAPFCQELARDAGLRLREVQELVVNLGPGSYTSLRVGLISAKMWAFVTGHPTWGVPSFAAIAAQTPAADSTLMILADALQGLVYLQNYRCTAGEWLPEDDLRIVSRSVALETDPSRTIWSGPAVAEGPRSTAPVFQPSELSGRILAPAEWRSPTLKGLWWASRKRSPLPPDAIATIEPLYLRPSSAEEQADRLRAAPTTN